MCNKLNIWISGFRFKAWNRLGKVYKNIFTYFINEIHPEENSSKRFIECMNRSTHYPTKTLSSDHVSLALDQFWLATAKKAQTAPDEDPCGSVSMLPKRSSNHNGKMPARKSKPLNLVRHLHKVPVQELSFICSRHRTKTLVTRVREGKRPLCAF